MRRLGYVLASLVMAMSLTGTTAMADIEWCAEDPVVNIRGTVFRLTTNIQASASSVSGLTYEIVLPSDAQGITTVAYPQGKRLPTTVNVSYTGPASSEGAYSVSASVTVDGPAGTAVRLDVSGPTVQSTFWEGFTNSAVSAIFTASK